MRQVRFVDAEVSHDIARRVGVRSLREVRSSDKNDLRRIDNNPLVADGRMRGSRRPL